MFAMDRHTLESCVKFDNLKLFHMRINTDWILGAIIVSINRKYKNVSLKI